MSHKIKEHRRRILLKKLFGIDSFPASIKMKDLAEISGYPQKPSGYSNGVYLAMNEFKKWELIHYSAYKDCCYTLESVNCQNIVQALSEKLEGLEASNETTLHPPEVQENMLALYIEKHSLVLRNQRIMLDRDLAMVYGVETRALNQQRERNPEKFPEDFAYQLTGEELDTLTRLSQNVITSTKFSPVNPWAYTLEGCNMAATILNTPTAVKRAMQIIRIFF